MTWTAAILGAAAAIALAILIPRLAMRRSQDRLADRLLARDKDRFRLLTRADLVLGRYRRMPGVLGLAPEGLSWEGIFGDSVLLPTERIRKVVTGRRLASGRDLLRMEALRLTRSSGEELEFVLSHASAEAWRSHLGLWAAAQRQADAERVTPGRA